MLVELVQEVAQATDQRQWRGLPQPAERHLDYMVAPLLHDLYVVRPPASQGYAVDHVQQVLRADAAGHALAARLVAVEAAKVAANLDYACAVVVHHVSAGAHRPAEFV